jgi:hypothetical protein
LAVNHHVKLGLFALVALPACGGTDRVDEPAVFSVDQASLAATAASVSTTPVGSCKLNSPGGAIQHVVYIQFDNVHFTRDNPNVPSDLEQMPNLLNFLEGSGTLLSNHHTPLISHTADDILTALTGVYGDRHGQPVANSFDYFTSTGTPNFTSSFTYWTDPVNTTTDTSFSLLTPTGQNAPAPWVPYTRAGCNVGAVSIANIELENVTSDLNTVFGPTSAEVAEAKANRTLAVADFEGIAVHCAAGDAFCAASAFARPDVLPQEPGGYAGYSALYGHKYVAPVINPGGPLEDLDGNLITDGHGNNGFPGFGGISASQTLAYVAMMLEHGVPVTFAYISDAHDNHAAGQASGPGQADYVAQLAAADSAFGKFFARLAGDGITPKNTLFVVTADEGDHFVGGPPSPANCDGVTIPCTYAAIGEIDANMETLLTTADPTLTTAFDIHFDMAPTFYVNGNPPPGAPIARQFERDVSQLTAVSPITGNTDRLTEFLADPVEMQLLHMVTGDPQRTPTFVMFGDPDYFFQLSGPAVQENPGFAWNHGGTNPEITTTWLGLVGPGVKKSGVDDSTWSDHTDIRPTMLALLGLQDDYAHDGRVLSEEIKQAAVPDSMLADGFKRLARAYKQIQAPVGTLGMTTLAVSTVALSGDDATYARLENQLRLLTAQRNALAATIVQQLEGAEFQGVALGDPSVASLVRQANALIAQAQSLVP